MFLPLPTSSESLLDSSVVSGRWPTMQVLELAQKGLENYADLKRTRNIAPLQVRRLLKVPFQA